MPGLIPGSMIRRWSVGRGGSVDGRISGALSEH